MRQISSSTCEPTKHDLFCCEMSVLAQCSGFSTDNFAMDSQAFYRILLGKR